MTEIVVPDLNQPFDGDEVRCPLCKKVVSVKNGRILDHAGAYEVWCSRGTDDNGKFLPGPTSAVAIIECAAVGAAVYERKFIQRK